MSNLNGRIIVPSLAFDGLSDDAFMSRVNAIDKGMEGNPAYDASPVPPAVFKAGIAAYLASHEAALDGGNKAIEDCKQKRAELTLMLRVLGHYVEYACNGDMATFLSSGFLPFTHIVKPPQPLAQPTIRKINQGTTGQLFVIMNPVPGARTYDLQDAVVNGGVPGEWTMITLSKAKKAVPYNGLIPGTIYAFRVRAYGVLGFTDWSDFVTRMCI